MSEVKQISYSRVQAWRTCHCRHYWRYVENLQRVTPLLPLERGRVIHSLIEAHLKGESWEKVLDAYTQEYDKLFDEEKETLGDLPHDLERLMKGYVRTWETSPLSYPVVEYKFHVPLFFDDDTIFLAKVNEIFEDVMDGAEFVGKIDAIAQDGGKTWIVEHKTVSRIPDEGVRFFDMQTALYLYAVRMSKELSSYQPTGILWDYIRTKPPVEPEVLKSGRLSERKNMDTDYHTYYNAIVSRGQNPDEYSSMLNMLREKPNTFYKRFYMPVASDALLNSILSDFQISAIDILLNEDDDRVKTLSTACNSCEYRELCQAELTGGDVEFVKTRSYQKIKEV